MKGVVGRMYVCIGQKQLRDCGSRRPTTYIVTCLVPFVTVSADSGRKSNYPAVRRVPHCHGERTQIALGPRSVAPQIRSSCPLDFIVIREDHTCVQQSGACETRLRLQVIKPDNLLQTFPTTTDTCQPSANTNKYSLSGYKHTQ